MALGSHHLPTCSLSFSGERGGGWWRWFNAGSLACGVVLAYFPCPHSQPLSDPSHCKEEFLPGLRRAL